MSQLNKDLSNLTGTDQAYFYPSEPPMRQNEAANEFPYMYETSPS